MDNAKLLAEILLIRNSDFIFMPFKKKDVLDYYKTNGLYDKANNICHYCSIDVLKSILQNQCLRFTDVRFLNDTTEFTEIMEIIPTIIKNSNYSQEFKNIFLDEELINTLKNYKQSYTRYHSTPNGYEAEDIVYRTYTCSLSLSQDSLYMWNSYSSGNGVNICFNHSWKILEGSSDSNPIEKNILENGIQICRAPVIYEYEDKEKCIVELLNRLNSIYEKSHEGFLYHKEILLDAYEIAVNNMRCFMKNINYKIENEYRFVLRIPETLLSKDIDEIKKHSDIMDVNYFIRGNCLIPYVDYKINTDGIKHIVISPHNSKETKSTIMLGIDDLLKQKKLNDVKVYKSNIPSRNYQ